METAGGTQDFPIRCRCASETACGGFLCPAARFFLSRAATNVSKFGASSTFLNRRRNRPS